jgi:chaperone required for assembly of F1-ATPase
VKRLYREVAVTAEADGFGLALDGKRVNTPAGAALVVRSRGLAEAVAAEWAAQGEQVLPDTMPLMQLTATALDRVASARPAAIEQLLSYGETDLLCYRATEPAELVDRQAAIWQPLLDWAALRFGAELAVIAGLMPQPQPAGVLAALRAALAPADPFGLTGLLAAASAAGSLILALALQEGRLSADEVWALSLLDETFQIERWGEDAEAAARRAGLRADLRAAGRFLALAAA